MRNQVFGISYCFGEKEENWNFLRVMLSAALQHTPEDKESRVMFTPDFLCFYLQDMTEKDPILYDTLDSLVLLNVLYLV